MIEIGIKHLIPYICTGIICLADLSVPEAFLAVDGILSLYANVADGLVVIYLYRNNLFSSDWY